MTSEFLDWALKNVTDKASAKTLLTMWQGWLNASKEEKVSLIKGIGPYCDGWNAYMRLHHAF